MQKNFASSKYGSKVNDDIITPPNKATLLHGMNELYNFILKRKLVVFIHIFLCLGGFEPMIRLWQPGVTTKPLMLLTGHQSAVIYVTIDRERELVISFSESKEIRVHDLLQHTCIQTFYKNMMPNVGPRAVGAVLYNPVRAVS